MRFMKTLRWSILPGLMVIAGLTGCETTPQGTRIAKYPELFERLPDNVREEVTKGNIAKGYAPEMVFLALGRPDGIETAADGRSFVWTYRQFYPGSGVVSQPIYAVPDRDPLEDVRQAWVNNQSRVEALSRPEYERRRPDETWADYARRNPSDPRLRNELTDRVDRQRHTPDPDQLMPVVRPVTLMIIFDNQIVADALIDGGTSAFGPDGEARP